MRAILINPHISDIKEIEVGDSIFDWYAPMKWLDFNIQTLAVVSSPWPNHDLYVDDEGLFKPGNKSFMLKHGHPEPLFGCGLLLGFNPKTGDSKSATIGLVDVQSAYMAMPFTTRVA